MIELNCARFDLDQAWLQPPGNRVTLTVLRPPPPARPFRTSAPVNKTTTQAACPGPAFAGSISASLTPGRGKRRARVGMGLQGGVENLRANRVKKQARICPALRFLGGQRPVGSEISLAGGPHPVCSTGSPFAGRPKDLDEILAGSFP